MLERLALSVFIWGFFLSSVPVRAEDESGSKERPRKVSPYPTTKLSPSPTTKFSPTAQYPSKALKSSPRSQPSTRSLRKWLPPRAKFSRSALKKGLFFPSKYGLSPAKKLPLLTFPLPTKKHYLSFGLSADYYHYFSSPITSDFEGNSYQPDFGKTFLTRLALEISFFGPRWRLFFQQRFLNYDLLYGSDSFAGDRFQSPISSRASGFSPVNFPRHLNFKAFTPIGFFLLGITTSDWGLGILANGGDRARGEFYVPRFGDIVGRILLAVPILSLFTSNPALSKRFFIAGGFDLVILDDYADIFRGDRAYQGVISSFYRLPGDKLFAGVYIALREQRNSQGARLSAQAYDIYLSLKDSFYEGQLALSLATEWVFIRGFTDLIRTEEGPDGVELASAGGVIKGGIALPKAGLRFFSEFGYGSGDANSYDRYATRFSFDPDYQPSLILFSRVMSAVSAQSAARLASPSRVSTPPLGADQLPSYSRVNNVLYFQVGLAYQPFRPFIPVLSSLELKVGFLFAQTAADFVDPYYSFKAGGINTTPFGEPAISNRDLGMEMNLSLSYRYKFFRAALIYGRFFPGSAFKSERKSVEPVDQVQFYLNFSI